MDTNYTANKAKEFSNQAQDFFKSFSKFSVPSMDFNDLFNLARRNMEACSAANQVMMEGVQAINKRTAEVIQSNVEKCLSMSRDMMSSTSPEANGKKSSEAAKDAFSSSVNSVREISEMISKSTFEAFDVLNKRTAEALEESSKLMKKAA
jgi:phasin family protein